jgi:hypothetical protein
MSRRKPAVDLLTTAEQVAVTDAIHTRGMCTRAGADPDDWYEHGANGYKTQLALDKARSHAARLCHNEAAKAPCPVQLGCLLLAITKREQHGIWGGRIPYDIEYLTRNNQQLATLLTAYRAGEDRVPDDP